MTKPRIEEIVTEWKRQFGTGPNASLCVYITREEIDAFEERFALWRERGAMIAAIHVVLDEHDGDDAVGRIRDVLYGGAEDKI
jgi:hypothetical protein